MEEFENVLFLIKSYGFTILRETYEDYSKSYTIMFNKKPLFYVTVYNEEDDDSYEYPFWGNIKIDTNIRISSGTNTNYVFHDTNTIIKILEIFLRNNILKPKKIWNSIIMELYTI